MRQRSRRRTGHRGQVCASSLVVRRSDVAVHSIVGGLGGINMEEEILSAADWQLLTQVALRRRPSRCAC